MTTRHHPSSGPTSDREIVITRTIDGPRRLVFEAFTDVRHLSRWFGPKGFTTTTRAFEFAEGGAWDFVMHGPDGADYPNWITWQDIKPPERIAMLHGTSAHDPDAFESIITFADHGETTEITLRNVFRTAELRDQVVEKYDAIEGARQTLERLASYIADRAGLTP